MDICSLVVSWNKSQPSDWDGVFNCHVALLTLFAVFMD